MKKLYPSREKDRWEHALTRPVSSRTKFELLELMRADLFEYLDVLTNDPHTDKKSRAWGNAEIQRTTDRLKVLWPRRAKALHAAFEAGRVDYLPYSPKVAAAWHCGPHSQQLWEEVHQLWSKGLRVS